MRILLFAAVLALTSVGLHFFSGEQSVELKGIRLDLMTIQFMLYFLAALLVVEGLWQIFRRRQEQSLQSVIEAEKSARITAERESQVAQDDLKSVTNRAENAERRVRDLVAQNDSLQAAHSNEVSQQKLALQNAESKIASLEKAANTDAGSGAASVVALLGLLQEQGRFIDFLMEDITVYPDERVAGAARFVHAGCSSVVKQYMDLMPIQGGETGRQITVEKEMTERSIRFVGSSTVSYPATGKLLHKGWKATRLVLPKAKVATDSQEGVVVAPAEVEVAR